jgi:hypothetical protein
VPGPLWTTEQCAEHCGVKPKVWRDYVARAGAPRPVLRQPGRGQNLFNAAEVIAWQASRRGPGRRRRTDIQPSTKEQT